MVVAKEKNQIRNKSVQEEAVVVKSSPGVLSKKQKREALLFRNMPFDTNSKQAGDRLSSNVSLSKIATSSSPSVVASPRLSAPVKPLPNGIVQAAASPRVAPAPKTRRSDPRIERLCQNLARDTDLQSLVRSYIAQHVVRDHGSEMSEHVQIAAKQAKKQRAREKRSAKQRAKKQELAVKKKQKQQAQKPECDEDRDDPDQTGAKKTSRSSGAGAKKFRERKNNRESVAKAKNTAASK